MCRLGPLLLLKVNHLLKDLCRLFRWLISISLPSYNPLLPSPSVRWSIHILRRVRLQLNWLVMVISVIWCGCRFLKKLIFNKGSERMPRWWF